MKTSELIQNGFRVFPVHPQTKAPLTRNGFKDASNKTQTVKSWEMSLPKASWAVPTEGLVVVDLDVKNGNNGIASWESLTSGLEVPPHPIAKTMSGGEHHYFRQGDLEVSNSVGLLGDGIDIRATGGYVVVPPSEGYEWLVGLETEIPQAPEWLIDLIDKPKSRINGRSAEPIQNGKPETKAVVEGGRNDFLFKRASSLRGAGLTTNEIFGAISVVNQKECDPPLDEKEVHSIAQSAGKQQVTVDATADFIEKSPLDGPLEVTTLNDYREYAESLDWIWPNFLCAGQTHLVAGYSKVGKTWYLLDLARTITNGLDFVDGTPNPYGKPMKVLYVETESRMSRAASRSNEMGIDPNNFLVWNNKDWGAFNYSDQKHKELLKRHFSEVDDLALVLIDSFRGMGDSAKESEARVANKIKWLSSLAQESGIPVVVTQHPRKPQRGYKNINEPDIFDVAGSHNIVGQSSHVTLLWNYDPNDEAKVGVKVEKNDGGPSGTEICMEIFESGKDGDVRLINERPQRVSFVTEKDESTKDVLNMVDEIVSEGVPVKSADFYGECEEMGVPEYKARRIVNRSGKVFSLKYPNKPKGVFYLIPKGFDVNDENAWKQAGGD